jgi:hypothetical protein
MKRFLQIIWAACMMNPLLANEPRLYSELWGEHGEKWTPQSRLPDFSFAGYHSGEKSPPRPAPVANVRDFGAIGDGIHDDTAAFIKAIETTREGVILIPAGRYLITDILWIQKTGLVLRGEGPDRSVLYFTKGLEEVLPNMGATTGGRPTSNYSWSGGFVWIKGETKQQVIAPISSLNKRGDRTLTLEKASDLKVGQRVAVEVHDDENKTLLDYLYSGDPGDVSKIKKKVQSVMVSRVQSVEGPRVTLERPLRFDLRTEWSPVLKTFEPTVNECGIEDLGFEFPLTSYEGHFTEIGFNAIAINQAVDCWIRNVRIRNSDSGIFLNGMFCTADGIVIESDRPIDHTNHSTGHHGLTPGTDCVMENFDIRTRFIHDISVDHFSAGNVVKNGRGVDLSLDHHKRAPYENLFCNLDAGKGTVVWLCGGGLSLGKHCAARGTFWGLRAEREIDPPGKDFGPDSMNFIGIRTSVPTLRESDGKWVEAIDPLKLHPADLHAAQLKRRLEK